MAHALQVSPNHMHDCLHPMYTYYLTVTVSSAVAVCWSKHCCWGYGYSSLGFERFNWFNVHSYLAIPFRRLGGGFDWYTISMTEH